MHNGHDDHAHSCSHVHEHTHVHSHPHGADHDHGHSHDHDHEHEHSHTHTHEHIHDHEHSHEHGHSHDHVHPHSHDVAPKDELLALIRYMVDHNTAHAHELEGLAAKIGEIGEKDACAKIMNAVRSFEEGNRQLAKVLEELK